MKQIFDHYVLIVILFTLTFDLVGGVGASGELFGKQIAAVLLAAFYSYVVTFILLVLLSKCMVLKPSPEEMLDLDMAFHGEESYGKHTGRDGPLPRNSKYDLHDRDLNLHLDNAAGAESSDVNVNSELDLEIATVTLSM